MPTPKKLSDIDKLIREKETAIKEKEDTIKKYREELDTLNRIKQLLKEIPFMKAGNILEPPPERGASNSILKFLASTSAPVSTGQIVEFYAKLHNEDVLSIRDNVYATLNRLVNSGSIIKESVPNMRGHYYKVKE